MNRRPLLISLVSILVIAFGSLIGSLVAGNKPQLGLDLQGGASVTLRPVGTFTPEALDEIPNIYRSRVDGLGVAEPEILRQGDTIVVNLPGVADEEEAVRIIGATGKVLFRPVLGQQFLGTPIDKSKIGQGTPEPSVSFVQVPPATTIAGPTIAVGQPTTVVDVPGTDAPVATDAPAGTDAPATSAAGAPRSPHQAATSTTAAAKSVTTTTGPDSTDASATTDATGTTDATATTDASDTTDATATTTAGSTTTVDPNAPTTTVDPNAPTTTLPPFDASVLVTPAEQDTPNSEVFLPSRDGLILYSLGPAFAYGEEAIASATPRFNNGSWEIELNLKDSDGGIGAWNRMASICYSGANGGPTDQCAGGMAFVLDHEVVSAPVPSTPSFSSSGISITGRFSEQEASELAQVLKYGASPVEMAVQTKQTVSATLGKDSLSAALIAGLIGIALVLLFMLAYYRSIALIVVAGLAVSGALLWSVISLLSKTQGLALTLAGVTGIIVSVGVTVDSYVVFFERLKDEAQTGKTLRSSAQRSFKSAWRTILAADIVSLIGAFVLWKLTVGSVKGFAFFLGLSTLCDLVVSYFFTRPAVLLLARSSKFRGDKLLGVVNTQTAGGAL